jgi:hypothetical protein
MSNSWTDLNEEEQQRIGLARKFGVEIRAERGDALVSCSLVTHATSKNEAAEALREEARKVGLMLLDFARGITNPLYETAFGNALCRIFPMDEQS